MSELRAEYRLDARLASVLAWTAGVGAAVFVAGAIVVPERAWAGLLAGFHYVLGLGLAGTVFLALLACSGSKWAAALRRVPEAMSRALPVAAVPAAILVFGAPAIFPWAGHHGEHGPHAQLLEDKAPYLNVPFLIVRIVLCFALWIWCAKKVRDAAPGAARVRWGAAFMAVFGVTYSVVSVDWLQSLDPEFASTAFAITTLAGLALSGVAAGIVLAVHLRRNGAWQGVLTTEHLHDLAKLLFGFSLFWSYLQYTQYMLIWYTNMPEETGWYTSRLAGTWWTTGAVSFTLNGVLPFVLLLFRRVRRSETALARIACGVLVGRLAELAFHVGPPLLGPSPWPGLWEILPAGGLVALFALVTLRGIASRPVVKSDEPGIDYSRHYHA